MIWANTILKLSSLQILHRSTKNKNKNQNKFSYFRRKCQEWNAMEQNEFGIPRMTTGSLFEEGFYASSLEKDPTGRETQLTSITWFKYTSIHRRHSPVSSTSWPHPILKHGESCSHHRSKYFGFAKAQCWRQFRIMARAWAHYIALPLLRCVSPQLWASVFPIRKILVPMGLLLGLNELIDVKDFQQCLTESVLTVRFWCCYCLHIENYKPKDLA